MVDYPALYTARAENVGGTSGQVRIPGAHDTVLPTGGPAEGADGYNPEQFLAMAWSTCLGETLRVVIAERGLEMSSQVSVEVGLHRDPAGGYRFAPRALVTIEGIEDMAPGQAQQLVDAAHARCPLSKLLTGQGNAVVELAG